jgi:hypothetical protein
MMRRFALTCNVSFANDDAFEDSINITQGSQLLTIAPNLAKSQINLIIDMNSSERVSIGSQVPISLEHRAPSAFSFTSL